MLTCILCNGLFLLEEMSLNGMQKPSYCKVCYNQKKQALKSQNPEDYRTQDRSNHKRHRANNPEQYHVKDKIQRLRHIEATKAVNAVNNDLKSPNGVLVRQPCEVCGSKAQAHHNDYSKPLEVRWLCPLHHKHIAVYNER